MKTPVFSWPVFLSLSAVSPNMNWKVESSSVQMLDRTESGGFVRSETQLPKPLCADLAGLESNKKNLRLTVRAVSQNPLDDRANEALIGYKNRFAGKVTSVRVLSPNPNDQEAGRLESTINSPSAVDFLKPSSKSTLKRRESEPPTERQFTNLWSHSDSQENPHLDSLLQGFRGHTAEPIVFRGHDPNLGSEKTLFTPTAVLHPALQNVKREYTQHYINDQQRSELATKEYTAHHIPGQTGNLNNRVPSNSQVDPIKRVKHPIGYLSHSPHTTLASIQTAFLDTPDSVLHTTSSSVPTHPSLVSGSRKESNPAINRLSHGSFHSQESNGKQSHSPSDSITHAKHLSGSAGHSGKETFHHSSLTGHGARNHMGESHPSQSFRHDVRHPPFSPNNQGSIHVKVINSNTLRSFPPTRPVPRVDSAGLIPLHTSKRWARHAHIKFQQWHPEEKIGSTTSATRPKTTGRTFLMMNHPSSTSRSFKSQHAEPSNDPLSLTLGPYQHGDPKRRL